MGVSSHGWGGGMYAETRFGPANVVMATTAALSTMTQERFTPEPLKRGFTR